MRLIKSVECTKQSGPRFSQPFVSIEFIILLVHQTFPKLLPFSGASFRTFRTPMEWFPAHTYRSIRHFTKMSPEYLDRINFVQPSEISANRVFNFGPGRNYASFLSNTVEHLDKTEKKGNKNIPVLLYIIYFKPSHSTAGSWCVSHYWPGIAFVLN